MIAASSNSLRRPSITSLQRKCHSCENLSTTFNIVVGEGEPNMVSKLSSYYYGDENFNDDFKLSSEV